MTAIACYYQRENDVPYVWAVADSRVSLPGDFGGNRVLNDHATKIFSVPYVVRTGTDGGRLIGNGSFGYCYSGSSLTGLNTHALLSHFFRYLQGTELPRFADIVEFVRSRLHQYVMDCAASVGERAVCECAIVGFCPVDKTPQIHVLRPDTSTGPFLYRVEVSDLTVDGRYVLLGDKKAEIAQLIDHAYAESTPGSINWWRSPWHGIQKAISTNAFPSIGGHIQLGVGSSGEFQVFGLMDTVDGKSGYGFLGTTTGSSIGPCRIGMPYMTGLSGFQEPQHH